MTPSVFYSTYGQLYTMVCVRMGHDFHTAVFSENTCYKQLLRSYESSFIQDCFQWVYNILPGEFLKSIYSSSKSVKDQL